MDSRQNNRNLFFTYRQGYRSFPTSTRLSGYEADFVFELLSPWNEVKSKNGTVPPVVLLCFCNRGTCLFQHTPFPGSNYQHFSPVGMYQIHQHEYGENPRNDPLCFGDNVSFCDYFLWGKETLCVPLARIREDPNRVFLIGFFRRIVVFRFNIQKYVSITAYIRIR